MTTIGSLFTGTGALDMAAASVLGGDVVWHADVKPAAVALLEHRLPGVPNLGDFAALFPAVGPLSAEADAVPRTTIVTSGWPCQPHSSAGKQLGEADPRALWPNVVRFLAEKRPAVWLGENVARIAGNGELRRVVRSLAAIGYVGAWRCVSASDVGAPHRRQRCFVAAVDPAAVADGRGLAQFAERHGRPVPRIDGERRLDAVGRGARGTDPVTLLPTPTQSMTTGAGTSGRDGGLNLQTAVSLLPTPKATDGTKGGPNMRAIMRVADGRWGVYAAAIARWEPIIGRPAPAPTVLSTRTGRPQLSAPFVEWMMGLPAGWVTDVAVTARTSSLRNAHLSLLGDGVVPQQAAAAYRFLLDHLAVRLAGEAA